MGTPLATGTTKFGLNEATVRGAVAGIATRRITDRLRRCIKASICVQMTTGS